MTVVKQGHMEITLELTYKVSQGDVDCIQLGKNLNTCSKGQVSACSKDSHVFRDVGAYL